MKNIHNLDILHLFSHSCDPIMAIPRKKETYNMIYTKRPNAHECFHTYIE